VPRARLDTGAVVAAVGAVLLAVSLFLDWFGSLSAWTTFEVLDLVLAALALLAFAAAADRLGYRTPVLGRWLTTLGAVATVIVASQLLNHPPLGIGRSPQLGAWLALGSSLLIAGGGLAGMARISVELVVDRGDGNGDRDDQTTRDVERAAAAEAAADEPKVERELYPRERNDAPLGADDPEPFGRASEEETRRIE
jgi:hypothetical protein